LSFIYSITTKKKKTLEANHWIIITI